MNEKGVDLKQNLLRNANKRTKDLTENVTCCLLPFAEIIAYLNEMRNGK